MNLFIRLISSGSVRVSGVVIALMFLLNNAPAASPVLLSVTPNPVGTELYLHFSEAVCSGIGGNGPTFLANYSVSPPGPVVAATVLADNQTVRLDFAPALSGSYTLKIQTSPGHEIFTCGTSNALVSPVTMPFTVTGTLGAPSVFATSPSAIGVDCGTLVTVYGAGFDASSTVELIPGHYAGASPVVNVSGTTLTATFPGGLTPGAYSVVVNNPGGAIVFPGQSSAPFAIDAKPITVAGNWPAFVNSCNNTTVTAMGSGFCPGATFTAVPTGGGSPLTASGVIVNSLGNQISGLFNFNSSLASSFDLVVQNPGGGSATRVNAVYVTTLAAWNVSPTRIGDCNTAQTLTVYGTFCPGDQVRLVPDGAGSTIPGSVVSIIPAMYWGEYMTASFNMSGATAGDYHLEFNRVGTWVPTSVKVTVVATSPCPLDVQIVGRTRVGYTIVNTFTINVQNLSCSGVPGSTLTMTVPPGATPTLSAPTAGGVISPANVITWSIPSLSPGSVYPVQFNMLLPNVNTTTTIEAVDSLSGCTPAQLTMSVVVSQDPNFKQGHPGKGALHRIVGTEVLPYEIHFENLPTATAPAQNVFVTDRLNPAQFDLSTFSLGDITFGNRVITPPAFSTSYSETIFHDLDGDLTTTSDQILLVLEANLITNPSDPDYGRLTWSYRTLDPATLDTPLDPMLGFLPPNQLPAAGEGSVKFTVSLKKGLIPNTQMGSAAVVVFDNNDPIFTNPWFNAIAIPPNLKIQRSGDQVQIIWIGATDDWFLEQTSALDLPSWTPVDIIPVTISGGRQQVSLTPSDSQVFYRLRRY